MRKPRTEDPEGTQISTAASPTPPKGEPLSETRLRPGLEGATLPEKSTALGMKRAPIARFVGSSARVVRWQVFTCAGLCAAGATLGLITVLGELRYQFGSPSIGVAYGSASLCGGIVLGLWMPRRIIRRRLARGTGERPVGLPTSGGQSLRLEFAASLSGALIVAFALTWVVLCGGTGLMEDYRAFLAARFVHPIWVRQWLLRLPACAGLAIAGATGTTLLVALHGWYRLAAQPNTNITRLWVWILLGALAAGLGGGQAGLQGATAWLAPLAVFVAALVAVWRRTDAVGLRTPAPTERAPAREEVLHLLAGALAAATAATAFFLTMADGWVSGPSLAVGVAVLSGAGGLGLWAARVILRLRPGAALGPLALLLTAAALLGPYQELLAARVNLALVRLAVVCGCAAGCIVLVSHRISQTSRSVQYALSWIGGSVAAGFGLTLALLPAGAAHWGVPTSGMIVALVATLGAGVGFILEGHARRTTRVIGLAGVGVWLLCMPAATRSLADAPRTNEEAWRATAADPLRNSARRLLIADGFRTLNLRPLPPSMEQTGTWDFDLAGPPVDLVVIERVSATEADIPTETELGRRLLRRVLSRLAQGGRLVVEVPTTRHLAAALAEFEVKDAERRWTGYRLRVQSQTREYEAVAFGEDIPMLIERRIPAPGLTVSLQPLDLSADSEP